MPGRPPLLFWLAFAYWGGVAGAVAFSVAVHTTSRSLWYPREAVVAHFTLVFQGALLFLALALLLVLLALRAPPSPLPPGGPRETEFRAFLKEGVRHRRLPSQAVLALSGTLALAGVLLAMSLWFVSGTHAAVGGTFAATNAFVIFGYVGVLVLLFPGLAYLTAATLRTRSGGDGRGAR